MCRGRQSLTWSISVHMNGRWRNLWASSRTEIPGKSLRGLSAAVVVALQVATRIPLHFALRNLNSEKFYSPGIYFNRRRRKMFSVAGKSINQQQKNSEEKFKCAKRYHHAVNGRAVNKITLTTCVGRQDARRKFNLNWMSLSRVFRAVAQMNTDGHAKGFAFDGLHSRFPAQPLIPIFVVLLAPSSASNWDGTFGEI